MQIAHPLLNKIRELQEAQSTGFLQLEKENQNIILCFEHGLISAAGTSMPDLKLGRILTKRGAIQNTAIPKLLDKARRKHVLLGKAAVLGDLVDETELKEALRDQAVQVVAYAMAKDFDIGSFEDKFVSLYVPARLNHERLILELARSSLKPSRLDPHRLISLNNGHNLSQIPWYPQELSVLGQLKTPRTLQDLEISTGIGHERLGKILCVFDSLQLITQVDVPPVESTAIVKRNGFPFFNLTPEIGDAGLSAKMEAFHNPSSFVSEQFKNLKVRIAEMSTQAPLHVVAVASPHTEDGKSLVCANLAVSFAKETGKKVILLDCDLRNPSLQKLLGTSVEPGLMGYLENDHLQAHCYMRRLGRMFFMTAGGVSTDPVELLSSARMQDLIEYLKTEFDTVILDCPPFGPISDAQILTHLADGLLMVVRCGKTTYGTMEKAFRNFDRSKLIGLVFNDVKPMMFNTQYHYKYYRYRDRNNYPYGTIKPSRPSKNYLD